MDKKKYVYWKDEDMWLGYLEEFPDYITQGETEAELRENLLDIYKDLISGVISQVRRVAELENSTRPPCEQSHRLSAYMESVYY